MSSGDIHVGSGLFCNLLRILWQRNLLARYTSLVHDFYQVGNQNGNVFKKDVFENIPVDTLIVMGNPVSKTNDIPKGDATAKLVTRPL